MPDFVTGIELSRAFYREVVRPIIDGLISTLAHSAALIGEGSEVLGYDTEMSTDHDWGPRLLLFLQDQDAHRKDEVDKALRRNLPAEFRGWQRSGEGVNGADGRAHRIQVVRLGDWFDNYLAVDPMVPLTAAGWLTIPSQKLRAVTEGAVYHDDLNLTVIRERLQWYPHDVWLYLLAAGWNRIGQEEHLMGRAGFVGDELGSAIIGARLVRDIMTLCFLMERKYAPYPKWFGTAFQELDAAAELSPPLRRVLRSEDWREREEALCAAYEAIARRHNALQITEELPEKCAPFFGRPFHVIHSGGGFAEALRSQIQDEEVKRIAARRLLGGIDQISDNTDLLTDAAYRHPLCSLYEGAAERDEPV